MRKVSMLIAFMAMYGGCSQPSPAVVTASSYSEEITSTGTVVHESVTYNERPAPISTMEYKVSLTNSTAMMAKGVTLDCLDAQGRVIYRHDIPVDTLPGMACRVRKFDVDTDTLELIKSVKSYFTF